MHGAPPGQQMQQHPSTLGAQFTDPRKTTGAGPRRGRALLFVLLAILVVLGAVATVLIVTGARESPLRARTDPSAKIVTPTPAPSAMGQQPMSDADAGPPDSLPR